jgi:hypothetical protein
MRTAITGLSIGAGAISMVNGLFDVLADALNDPEMNWTNMPG